jgi:hypothetical protein
MRLTHLGLIVIVLLSASSLAQMRGGAGRGFSGRPGFGGRPGFIGRPGLVAAPHHGVRFVGGSPNRPFLNNGPFFTCGFTPCSRPIFAHGFSRFGAFPIWGGGFWDGFWDDGYTVPDTYDFDTQPQADEAPALPSKLEVTLVDQRESDNAEAKRLPDAKLIELPSEPTIFVFRDGSRKEMTSFAIMGGQLIDLSNGKTFRIPLDQIDRKATLAANAKAGREIQMSWLK